MLLLLVPLSLALSLDCPELTSFQDLRTVDGPLPDTVDQEVTDLLSTMIPEECLSDCVSSGFTVDLGYKYGKVNVYNGVFECTDVICETEPGVTLTLNGYWGNRECDDDRHGVAGSSSTEVEATWTADTSAGKSWTSVIFVLSEETTDVPEDCGDHLELSRSWSLAWEGIFDADWPADGTLTYDRSSQGMGQPDELQANTSVVTPTCAVDLYENHQGDFDFWDNWTWDGVAADAVYTMGKGEVILDANGDECLDATLDRLRVGHISRGDYSFCTADADSDGFSDEVDCDEADAGTNPGAWDRTLDGVDQDCDGADGNDPALDTGDTAETGDTSDTAGEPVDSVPAVDDEETGGESGGEPADTAGDPEAEKDAGCSGSGTGAGCASGPGALPLAWAGALLLRGRRRR